MVSAFVDLPNHNMLATGSFDTTVLLWDAETLLQVSKILDPTMGVRCLDHSWEAA